MQITSQPARHIIMIISLPSFPTPFPNITNSEWIFVYTKHALNITKIKYCFLKDFSIIHEKKCVCEYYIMT